MAETRPKKSLLSPRRLAVLAAFAAIIGALFAFDVQHYLSYQSLAENQSRLRGWVAAAPLLTMGAYMLVYIVVVAFSLPGAVWMTLAGGLMFGTLIGGALTVVAATIGAICIFLAARYVIGDVLRARGGDTLQRFEAAFNRDAASYLLVLRLLPIFPFFIVNLGAALVGAPFGVFAITTFLGIMPGTFVFASIGNGVAAVLAVGAQPDLSIITKPEIIGPLIALAVLILLPVIWRKMRRTP